MSLFRGFLVGLTLVNLSLTRSVPKTTFVNLPQHPQPSTIDPSGKYIGKVFNNLDYPIPQDSFLEVMKKYHDQDFANYPIPQDSHLQMLKEHDPKNFGDDAKGRTSNYFRILLPKVLNQENIWNCYTKTTDLVTAIREDLDLEKFLCTKSIEIRSGGIAFSVQGSKFVAFHIPKPRFAVFCWY